MRAGLSRYVRRRVRRGWLGYRRAGMERVPCRGSPPTSLWLWVRLAPEYASLLPAVDPTGFDGFAPLCNRVRGRVFRHESFLRSILTMPNGPGNGRGPARVVHPLTARRDASQPPVR